MNTNTAAQPMNTNTAAQPMNTNTTVHPIDIDNNDRVQVAGACCPVCEHTYTIDGRRLSQPEYNTVVLNMLAMIPRDETRMILVMYDKYAGNLTGDARNEAMMYKTQASLDYMKSLVNDVQMKAQETDTEQTCSDDTQMYPIFTLIMLAAIWLILMFKM